MLMSRISLRYPFRIKNGGSTRAAVFVIEERQFSIVRAFVMVS
jgi:hypothetical protein